MSVYRRTALGNEAALNRESALPRKLRTLLIAIDGKTRLNTYVNSLHSFGDVEALLESLLQAGLVEVAHTGNAAPASPLAGTSAAHHPLSSWSDTDTGRNAISNAQVSGYTAAGRAPIRGHDLDAASWSRFQPSTQTGFSRVGEGAGRPGDTAHYQLRNAISLMSDFVTRYLPQDSLEIVLSLESLGSVEQVMGSLKGYETLVAPIGEPARHHLAELRTVLVTF